MASSDPPVLIGIIGGSGLYHLDNLTLVKTVNPETPWGHPSSPITIFSLSTTSSSPIHIAFITRHGTKHTIPPSSVPSRANISSLKSLGVKVILAFSAVGSLREEISPGSFVLPNQIIDRTKGIRPSSFFTDPDRGIVAHASFGEPFSLSLLAWLEAKVGKALEGRDVKLFTGKTTVCMEGPQFSTRAESLMYRAWGGDLINMSALPEAKLAKEAEISYAIISMATDYDSWRPHNESVTAADVVKTLSSNADTARYIVQSVVEDLYHAITGSAGAGKDVQKMELDQIGTMKYAIMGRAEEASTETREVLGYVLPEYFVSK